MLKSEVPVIFGVGEAAGIGRGLEAAIKALQPLSSGNHKIDQASGVLVNITGSSDMTMAECSEINQVIHRMAGVDSTVLKFGAIIDERFDTTRKIKVTAYFRMI